MSIFTTHNADNINQDKSKDNTIDSRIKDVYIELPGYQYYHSPYDPYNDDKRFIGRQKFTEKIKSILENTKVSTGAYLITGIRGMGKSSFIKTAFKDYIKYPQFSKYLRFPIKIPMIVFCFVMLISLILSNLFHKQSSCLQLNSKIVFKIQIVLFTFSSVYYGFLVSKRFKKNPVNDNNKTKRISDRVFSYLSHVILLVIFLCSIIHGYNQSLYLFLNVVLFFWVAILTYFLYERMYPQLEYNLYNPIKDKSIQAYLISLWSSLNFIHICKYSNTMDVESQMLV